MKNKFFRRLSAIILTVLMVAAFVPLQASAVSYTEQDDMSLKKVAAPSDLKAELSPNMGIALSWTDNSPNESGFVLEKQLILENGSGTGFNELASLSINTTTYKDTISAAQFITYRAAEYKIKAKSGGLLNDSNYSSVLRVDFKTPEQPVVKATFSYDGSVNINWSGCTPAYVDQFDILRKGPGSSTFSQIASLAPDTTFFNDTSEKQPGGTYQYEVRPIGYFGYVVSLPVSITIAGTVPPAPTNLIVTPISDYSAKLSWEYSTDSETGFWIDWTLDGISKQSVNAGTTKYFTINGIPAGTATFKIRAANAAGSSAPSNTVTAHIPFITPAEPSNLAATALTDRSVSLTWTDNSDNEQSFYIERKKGSGDYIKIDETAANATNFTDVGLSPNTTYTYRIQALNSTGVSDYSGTASVTTKETAAADDIDYSTASSWAKPEIELASQYGLLTDRLDGSYQQDITREEFCEIAVKLYEKLSGKAAVPTSTNPFSDTANNELLKAYNIGITNGTSADRFSPGNPITRQEISVMLVRTLTAAIPGLNTSVSNPDKFNDERLIASWALPDVKFMSSEGIMKGVGGNLFNPLNQTTREQGIAIVKRAFESYN